MYVVYDDMYDHICSDCYLELVKKTFRIQPTQSFRNNFTGV